MKTLISQGPDQKWYVKLKSDDGELISASEGFSTRREAREWNPAIRKSPDTRQRKVKPTSVWSCINCDTREMSQAKILEHLHKNHGIDCNGLKGRKQMTSSLGGKDWVATTWEWEVKGTNGVVKLINQTMSLL